MGAALVILSKNKNQSNLISLPKVSWALRGRSGPDRPRCRPAGPAAAPLGTTSTRWRTQTLLAAWVRRVITWCMVYYHARRRSTYDVRIGNELMTTYILYGRTKQSTLSTGTVDSFCGGTWLWAARGREVDALLPLPP